RFVAKFWSEFFARIGTKLKMSTAFHPETDGLSERMNRTIEEVLRHYVNSRKNDWEDHLPLAEFAFNKSVNASTGRSPFEVVYGCVPRSPFEALVPSEGDPPAVVEVLRRQKAVVDDVIKSMQKAQERQKAHADAPRREGEVFKEGELVLLSTK